MTTRNPLLDRVAYGMLIGSVSVRGRGAALAGLRMCAARRAASQGSASMGLRSRPWRPREKPRRPAEGFTMGTIYKVDTDSLRYEDAYAERLAESELPRYRVPQALSDPMTVRNLVRDELYLDGNAVQKVATFCTTYNDDNVRYLMDISVNKNLIDKDEYPQSSEIENRCVHMLAALWNAPHAAQTIGCSTEGSSEACMLGGLALKWRWRAARRHRRASTGHPNLVCGPVQICWHKFARYFDVELRQVPLSGNALGMQPEQLKDYCDENTIGVVTTLGVTYTGTYEPVRELAAALDDIQEQKDLDIPIHVDAASGGFIAPFLHPDLEWDFRIPRVRSINASGHKYGLAPLGVGWVVWRDVADLPEDLVFRVDYLGGELPTFALNFSRPAGQVIAQYYLLLRHGHEGYRDIHRACASHARYIAEQLPKIGPFELLYDGQGALPAVCYRLAQESGPFSLYDLADQLRMRGWQVPTYKLPANRQDTTVQRILVRHGFSRELARLLVTDIKRSTSALTQGTSTPGTAFHHT
jgi:glutamate decarboxylase